MSGGGGGGLPTTACPGAPIDLTLAAEWISAFSQQDATGYHSLRITGLTPSLQKTSALLPGAAGGTPTAPQDLTELLLQTLGNGR